LVALGIYNSHNTDGRRHERAVGDNSKKDPWRPPRPEVRASD
jgi:hypothetical protein